MKVEFVVINYPSKTEALLVHVEGWPNLVVLMDDTRKHVVVWDPGGLLLASPHLSGYHSLGTFVGLYNYR